MLLEELKWAPEKVVGQKQTLRAIKNGWARTVIVALDAEKSITAPVLKECRDRNIEVITAEDMVSLGKASGIKVKAAVAAILK